MQGPEFWSQASGLKGQTDMADYVSLTDQRQIQITLLSPYAQKAIAAILGALDDKIELNRQMNLTLAEMAQAIFKSWFVDFDSVVAKAAGRQPFGMSADTAALFPDRFVESELGPIPAGWMRGRLDDVAEVIDCLHSKKPERAPEGPLLLQLNNIRDDGLIDLTEQYHVSSADYDKWTARIEACEGVCVITNVGRVGAVAQIPPGTRAALGRNMTALRCRADNPFPAWLICLLLSDAMREEIERSTDAGTILDSLNVSRIGGLRLVLPPREIKARAEAALRPLRGLMESNLIGSRTLATLRDLLLPKLLSGEIRVRQAETLVERAGA